MPPTLITSRAWK